MLAGPPDGTGDGSGEWFIDVQIPITAFRDLQGNRVVSPSSPIRFVYTTSASNTDPLQKDFMMDIKFLSLLDPIQFGDTVVLEATTPRVDFVTSALGHTDFYSTADQVYVTVSDSLPNLTLAGSQTVQCSTVTVTNPSTGDQESVRVCETGPTSGIYTNTPTFSGFYLSPPGTPTTPSCGVAGTSPALSNTALDTAWVNNFALTAAATDGNWLLTYNGGTSWTLSKESVSPVPIWTVTAGTAFSNDEMSFTLLQQPSPNAPVAGTTISLCVYGKRPLPTTTSTGVTGALTVQAGDEIYAGYQNILGASAYDSALILGYCQASLKFTRRDGTESSNFTLTPSTTTSDRIYVTAYYPQGNTSATTIQTVTVTLTSTYDSATLTLTETGVNTGVFRNTTALLSQIWDGASSPTDGIWEDVDTGTVTATMNLPQPCSNFPPATATASLFVTSGGGRVAFRNAANTEDVEIYAPGDGIHLAVDDLTVTGCSTYYAGPPPYLQVDVCSALTGDCEYVSLYQTSSSPASGIWFNTTALPTSATGTVVRNGTLKIGYDDTLTVSYRDCSDGDSVATNDIKTDTSYAFPSVATRASIRGVRVDPAGVVEFVTRTQRNTAAFNVYAVEEGRNPASRVRVNDEPALSPVPNSDAPIRYRIETQPITTSHVLIEEIETDGDRVYAGPFAVRGDEPSEMSDVELEQPAGGRPGVLRKHERAAHRPGGKARGREAALPSKQGIKVEVEGPGTVQLSATDLLAAGVPDAALRAPGRLKLFNQGSPVPLTLTRGPQGAAIGFRAEALTTDYTTRNTYVLTWEGTVPAPSVPLTQTGVSRLPGYYRVAPDLNWTSFAPPGADPWHWDFLFLDAEPPVLTFDLPGLRAGTGEVEVRVLLANALNLPAHVTASLNGLDLGSVDLWGYVSGQVNGRVPASALKSAGNELTFSFTSTAPWGIVLVEGIDLGVGLDPVVAPVPVEDISLRGYSSALPSLRGIDYLVITHADFLEQAGRLAAAKEAAGLRTAVVDVERAYDAFSGGIVDAEAVRALIARAVRLGVRYVALFGDDTFDPADHWQLGEPAFIPSLLVHDGDSGVVPSENRYADVDGDGRPDVAIGRLPASDAAEADVLVDKAIRAEELLTPGWGRHLFASDNRQPTDADFPALSREAATLLPGGATAGFVDVGRQPLATVRKSLLDGFRGNASMIHYTGHGGFDIWAAEPLLSSTTARGLANTNAAAVVFTWACYMQSFATDAVFGPGLGETLVSLPSGGAVASFGPAGITDPLLQTVFRRILYRHLAAGYNLGEAIRLAKSEAAATDPKLKTVVEGWNLLGDPALAVPLP